ncbi:hypothetical protein EAO73_11150 [Streptomyces sp. col6]|nr:hypothetical protein EAO73_11150 [Streptomyces sp. col6]
MSKPVTAVAHRGDPYRARENTLSSIRSALERGADAVEIDVRVTRDGVPVLLHDATLDRLWGHDLRLDRLTHQELTELTAGGVPTLREALLAAGAHRVMVDLPGLSPPSPIAAIRTVPARTPSPRSARRWNGGRTRSRSMSGSPGTGCRSCCTTPRWTGCGVMTCGWTGSPTRS